MKVSIAGLARTCVVAAAGAGLVFAATQVEGSVALGSQPKRTDTAPAATGAAVTSASLACPGSELSGVPGVDDIPTDTQVAGVTAPDSVLGDLRPSGDKGSVKLSTMAGKPLTAAGSQRGARVQGAAGRAVGVEVTASKSLAPGLAAAQAWWVRSGDRRALASTSCTRPGTDLWLLAGGGAPGRQERLVLTNPGGNPVTVDVTLHGPDGKVASGAGEGIVVPAHGRTAYLVDSIAPDIASPAIHVVANGGVVGAALNDSWLDGVRAAGSDTVGPTAAPSRDQVVPGVAIAGAARLRVVVPGPDEAVVQARLLTPDGPRALPKDGVVRVGGGTVRDIDLSGVKPGWYAVQVRADRPVVAGAMVERSQPGRPGDFAWSASSMPVGALAGTAVPTPSGDSSGLKRQLLLTSAKDQATAEVVTVDTSGKTIRQQIKLGVDGVSNAVLPGNATSVWVRRAAGDGEVRAAVLTWADDADGTLVTTTALTEVTLRTDAVTVRREPLG